MIHSYIKKAETAKGTNWEQKFQKHQNENICLTNLNKANNGNFRFWHLKVTTQWSKKRVANELK